MGPLEGKVWNGRYLRRLKCHRGHSSKQSFSPEEEVEDDKEEEEGNEKEEEEFGYSTLHS